MIVLTLIVKWQINWLKMLFIPPVTIAVLKKLFCVHKMLLFK